ncbi:S9 family peptidase [Janthinobacterium sp. AD80]|uniref:alpha/beta hydrolase family protein n=1 Tax=Janthinobacterium sp. AD80 TaxID=1528773 RepID=UPI000C8203CC|nr:prolyl oligopeptidase family serine peptidase [Janthinobacterium sp. AD80]PMQ15723.1 Prolyl tripeptidyl peptidase [Janthinobacterium sp. AD80]
MFAKPFYAALFASLCALAGTPAAWAADAPPATAAPAPATPGARIPIEHFFDSTSFSGAILSPDGRRLAVRVAPPGQRVRLAVLELASMQVKVVAFFSDADVNTFRWVNDQRLVFDLADRQLAQGALRYGAGLYAVNADGGNYRQLVTRNESRQNKRAILMLPWNTYLLQSIGDQQSDDVFVVQPDFTRPGEIHDLALLRLNTSTGISRTVAQPAGARNWLFDKQGQLRIAQAPDGGNEVTYYRDSAEAPWRVLARFDAYHGGKDAFSPAFFAPDGTLYVHARHGSDKQALYRYDLEKNRIDDTPLAASADFDVHAEMLGANDRLLGLRYETDAQTTQWLDEKMQALQKQVNGMLPMSINSLSTGWRSATPFILVRSVSDTMPVTYYLFNSDTASLSVLGSAHPAILPSQMANKDLRHYQARDGLDIPAWLTLPKGQVKMRPMVVLVHGGPWVRNSWDWDAESQFLASRGYVVLEPEYRGSTGYGEHHFKAGWKQWGLKMQDDIADGARWAIAQGIADPRRICIAGASYGGYATLMGLINDPDLYRCGIDWLGVTDIDLLRNGSWGGYSNVSEHYRQYGMPVLIGDPVKDAAQFKATSPLQQAARITQPLLLAYGSADQRVPLPHGRQFYDAVRKTNAQVEWVEYATEGHGWALPATRVDFWQRVEKFLDRNIGPGSASQ